MAAQGGATASGPSLDAALFRRELDVTRAEFFGGILGLRLDTRQRATFDEWVFRLGERLDALPRLTCHRDFHGNNLFPLSDGSVGVIDFQDVRPGPLGYDLASLLFERSAVGIVDAELADDLIRGYARSLGLGVSDLLRAVGLCRLQRGWKAVGTFARELGKGRASYRAFLEAQLETLRQLLDDSGDGGTGMPDFLAEATRRKSPVVRASKVRPPALRAASSATSAKLGAKIKASR